MDSATYYCTKEESQMMAQSQFNLGEKILNVTLDNMPYILMHEVKAETKIIESRQNTSTSSCCEATI